jgi:hypothetical protein
MQTADLKKFAVLMATLAEVFNDGKEVSKIKMEIYFKSLEKYPIEHISQAISNMINNRVYPSFPKPAEILQEINGRAENRATEAWLKVVDAVARIGNYQSVKFSDPVIHSVVQVMGGWPQLCQMESKEEHWKQKEFERLYEVIASREGKHPDYLPGTVEMENYRTGFDREPEVVCIGYDKQKIKMIQ